MFHINRISVSIIIVNLKCILPVGCHFLEDYIFKEHLRANMMKISPSNLLCHKYSTHTAFKGIQALRIDFLLFILKVANIRCFILIKCSEQETRFKKYAIMS